MNDYYTWEQLDKDCKKIARWAKSFKFKNIFGVPRGGLVVAIRLSHLLNLPLELNTGKINKKTLVVDDICDKGKTLDELKNKIKINFLSATIYFKKNNLYAPTFFCRQKKNWVVFPWETKETSKYDGTF